MLYHRKDINLTMECQTRLFVHQVLFFVYFQRYAMASFSMDASFYTCKRACSDLQPNLEVLYLKNLFFFFIWLFFIPISFHLDKFQKCFFLWDGHVLSIQLGLTWVIRKSMILLKLLRLPHLFLLTFLPLLWLCFSFSSIYLFDCCDHFCSRLLLNFFPSISRCLFFFHKSLSCSINW